MAANQRLGAFVLDVAGLGKEVLSTFTKFFLTRKIRDRRLESLLAHVSITTSLLADLGTTINKYENEHRTEEKIVRYVCEACKADFEQWIMLANVAEKKGGWFTESADGNKSATEVDTFFIFDVQLGVGDKATQFWNILNETRGTIDALNCMIKYKVLKSLEQQKLLQTKQVKELKDLTATLPMIVLGLETFEKNRNRNARLATDKQERLKEDTLKTVKSSRQRRDVGEKDDFASFISEAEIDNLSEDTAIDPADTEGEKSEKKVQFENYNSELSISYYDPFPVSDTKLPTDIKTRTEILIDTGKQVVYEEWILRHYRPLSTPRRSWSILGLKLTSSDEDTSYWDISALLRSQTELRVTHQILLSSFNECELRSTIAKSIRALPKHARELIDWLVEDRTEATNNGRAVREWSVIAVRAKEKEFSGGRKWFKKVGDRDWLMMLKGETQGFVERTRPGRWEDPWHSPRSRKRYDNEEGIYERRRPRYEDEDPYTPRASNRRVRYDDDEESGNEMDEMDGYRSSLVNVGVFTGSADAERRMDRVLEDMAKSVVV